MGEQFDTRFLDWTEEAQKLVEENPFSKNLIHLIQNFQLGAKPYRDEDGIRYSNCCGTALYIAGYLEKCDRPIYVPPSTMDILLKKITIPGKIPGSFIVFRDIKGRINHTAIYLGEAAGLPTLFHQPGKRGEPFCLEAFNPNYKSRRKTLEYHIPNRIQGASSFN